jgi:hypothetical protein
VRIPTFDPEFLSASAEQVATFEDRHGVQLPNDYKDFLLTTNGGTPVPNTLTVVSRADALVAHRYGIRGERITGDLEQEQVSLRGCWVIAT